MFIYRTFDAENGIDYFEFFDKPLAVLRDNQTALTVEEYNDILHTTLLNNLHTMYENEQITTQQLADMVTNGEITQAEYDQITAE